MLLDATAGYIRWGFVSNNSLRWESFGMLRECKGLSAGSDALMISPAGWLTGKRNSKQVEEALPEGPLFHYNPSKWNQSGTMHPTVASKRSPHLSLSLVHKSFPLWRPSHLKSAVSHWQDKVATVFLIAMLIYRQRVSCLYKKRTLLQIAFFLYMCLKEGKDV